MGRLRYKKTAKSIKSPQEKFPLILVGFSCIRNTSNKGLLTLYEICVSITQPKNHCMKIFAIGTVALYILGAPIGTAIILSAIITFFWPEKKS